ncbi:MAG: hypothetical protein IT338_01470 [Thermomicrobiales bacterium]|nr:hypothetical protein [Thermomicrobiales bacterium]
MGRADRAETDDTPVTVIEIASQRGDERARHDDYLAAIAAVTAEADGTVLAICDILEPGTRDLLPYLGYAGGVATLLTFPSCAAWLAAILSDAWQSGLAARRAAVRDAIVLAAGENGIPPLARAMLGTPRPATDFLTPHIDGTTPAEIAAALLAVYPDSGADPTRVQLETMVAFPGFRDRPVHYINRYAFGEGDDPAVKGPAAHDAYNEAALPAVRAHGGYPLLRAPVDHRIVSAIPWSRVESAETYGNFVTVARADDAHERLAATSPL